MKEKDLKHKLQQTFNFSIWKEILPLFFKKIDYFSHPESFFSENDKVIEGKQIGTVKLDDGKQLAIFTVEVADSISIVRNRQGLRDIAAKHIDQNIIHGALAFFYNEKQADYRFSFIAKEASLNLETGELIKGETKPKRYTYLLGSNEACTTPAKRMLVLAEKKEKGQVNIKELKDVFSVEALNKDFFKTYKAHYEKFTKYLADETNPFRAKLIDPEKETKDKAEKPIRDFVKKLLGRIVFLQFLEKKGWMGCDANTQDWTDGNPRFMYQLFEDFGQPEKFHSQCLTKLFFETLNTKRPNDTFEVDGLNGKLNGSRVPYLNGGLFEPEKNKVTLEIDFPADYFKELLDFFDQYNFTIDENSPDDHEVGIDPEMLGHIFENLLEDNRDKGAFYTPKEIVQYMCKESLIQYLLNSPPLEGWLKAGVVNRSSTNYFNLPYNPALKQRAKELRQAGNLSEVLFWNQVKNKQFKGYDFDRQKIVGNYIVDFFCTNCNVVVEIDGSSHDDKQDYDAERDAYLQSLGLTVIHIPVIDVMKNMDSVMKMLENHPAFSDASLANKNHPALKGTPPKEGNWENAIEQFIRFHTVSPVLAEKENAILLNKKLDDIKVCDPAIGSGAFPIGMLQEIFEAKRLIYPYLKTNKDFKPAEVKKNIIQNSIYGVDLEKGAVDIAQLRFWLSLVVDELTPHPLPNLDYKIMQGNSLLESFEGIDLGKVTLFEEPVVRIVEPTLFEEPKADYNFSKEDKTNIKELISDYFKVEDKQKKTSIHKHIDNIVIDHLDKSLEFFENKLLIEIATYQKQLESKTLHLNQAQKDHYLQKSKEVKEIEKRQTQLQSKMAARKRLLEFENTDERPYFLWHLYFMDVFDPSTDSKTSTERSQSGGFDVIIGNPPYIQLQKMGKETDILQEAGFETFARTGDIYCLFYEKGFDLLKKGGILTYITSNKWMRGGYGKSLRNYFTKVNTQKILNLGPGIFHSATVDTNIYVGKKEPFKNQVRGISIENRFAISILKEDALIPMRDVNEDAWVVLDEADLKISKSFEKHGKPLKDWNLEIYRGVLTGFNEAFIIDQAKRDELVAEDPKADEIIRPILKGREIERYYAEWSKDFIISTFPAKNLNIESYPSIKKYLESFQPKLNQSGEEFINTNGEVEKTRKKTVNKWFETQDPISFQEEFKKEKVIWKRIGSIMRFAYSDEEMYCLDSTCIATGEKIKYLTAVLNSKAGLYQLFKTSPQTGTGDQIISVQALEPLLVHYPSNEVESKFNLLVDYILFIKKSKESLFQFVSNDSLSQMFEDVVNMMVYELYFEEEMKAKELDVLQFVTEKAFPDITQAEDKKALIQKVYYELQQTDNPIQNRILTASSRSETIARINQV